MSPGSVATRTFASLRRHRNYRLWFMGQVTSLTGTWVQNVATAWFVVDRTHSAVAVGVLTACQFGPYALFGLLGGAWVDRVDNRRLLIATQTSFMTVAILLTILALTGGLNVLEVDLAALLTGCTQVLDAPARQAFTVQMVGRDELPNAIALNSSLFNASRAIGPALGGLLLAATSFTVCFMVNSLSFLAVIGALLLMRRDDLKPVRRGTRTSMLRSVGEGLGYAWRDPDVRLVMGVLVVVATIGMNMQVLLPVLAKATLNAGPDTFGWLSAAFGGGALVGALVAATRGTPSWRTLLISGAIYSGALVALAPLGSLWACLIILAICGAGFSMYTSASNTTVQLTVPDRLRGRVLSLYAYLFFGTAPIGALLAGALADRSTQLAFSITGGLSLIAVAAGAAVRQASPHRRGARPVKVPEADTGTLIRE